MTARPGAGSRRSPSAARRDGTVPAYRIEILQDSGAYPRFGAFLPFLTILMAPGPYPIPRAEAWPRRWSPTPRPSAPTAAPGALRPPPRSTGPSTCSPTRPGLTPPRCGARTCCPTFTEPHTTAFGANYDSGDYAAALEKALDAADYQGLRAEQAKRRASGDPLQLGIGLSSYVEITGPGGEAGSPNENGTVEVHPDGTATVLDRHLAARPGPPDGVGDAGQRRARHPDRQDHRQVGRHRPGAQGRRHRRLPVAAARRRRGAAGIPRTARRGQGAGRRDAGGRARRPGLRHRDERVLRQGRPRRPVPLASLAESERLFVRSVFTAPGPTFPFGSHVAVVEVDTETARCSCAAWSPSTTRAR